VGLVWGVCAERPVPGAEELTMAMTLGELTEPGSQDLFPIVIGVLLPMGGAALGRPRAGAVMTDEHGWAYDRGLNTICAFVAQAACAFAAQAAPASSAAPVQAHG